MHSNDIFDALISKRISDFADQHHLWDPLPGSAKRLASQDLLPLQTSWSMDSRSLPHQTLGGYWNGTGEGINNNLSTLYATNGFFDKTYVFECEWQIQDALVVSFETMPAIWRGHQQKWMALFAMTKVPSPVLAPTTEDSNHRLTCHECQGKWTDKPSSNVRHLPSAKINSLLLKMAIEIVDLPMKNGDCP